MQHAGVAADDLVAAVAGDGAEAVVHLEDARLRVGDDDALPGVAEDAGGEAQVVLGGDPGGGVGEGAGGADQAVVVVHDRAHRQVHPAQAAVPVDQAQGRRAAVGVALHQRAQGFTAGLAVVRVEVVEEAVAEAVGHRMAADVLPGRVEELPVAVDVGLEDDLLHALEDLLVAGLALVQRLGGDAQRGDVGHAAHHPPRPAVGVGFHHAAPVAHPDRVAVGVAQAVLDGVAAVAQAALEGAGDLVAVFRMDQREEAVEGMLQRVHVAAQHPAPHAVVAEGAAGEVPLPQPLADGGQHVGQPLLAAPRLVFGQQALVHVAGEAEGADDLPVAAAHRRLEGLEPQGGALPGQLLDPRARVSAGHHLQVVGALGGSDLRRPQGPVGAADHRHRLGLAAGFGEAAVDDQEAPVPVLHPQQQRQAVDQGLGAEGFAGLAGRRVEGQPGDRCLAGQAVAPRLQQGPGAQEARVRLHLAHRDAGQAPGQEVGQGFEEGVLRVQAQGRPARAGVASTFRHGLNLAILLFVRCCRLGCTVPRKEVRSTGDRAYSFGGNLQINVAAAVVFAVLAPINRGGRRRGVSGRSATAGRPRGRTQPASRCRPAPAAGRGRPAARPPAPAAAPRRGAPGPAAR